MAQLICGIVRLDGAPADEAFVRRMANAMIAPGLRHAIGVGVHGPAAMAAIRLAVKGSDVALESPALIAEDGGLLAADITIHDRKRLDLAGAPADCSDAEFLNRALVERGAAAAADVHGDFAFADWRGGRLTLGRDHFGARPLVYAVQPGKYIAFASLPAALLRLGLAGNALDEGVATSWAISPAPPPGRTIFRDIRSVPAAHLVDDTSGDFLARRYWRLGTRRRLPFDSDPLELADEVRRLLTQAVERRLPKNGPGAGHLSGGLDSSSISVLAARALSRIDRRYFGYSFREPEGSPGLPGVGDAPVADLVAAAEPGISQVSSISPCLLLTYADGVDPETMVALSEDEPEEQVLRHAAEHGASVMFSGWGGDQIVSYMGRGAEVELLRAGRFARLWQHLRADASATGQGLAAAFLSNVVIQGLPQSLRDRLRKLVGRETPYRATIESQRRLIAAHRRKTIIIEPEPDSSDSHQNRRLYSETWYIQARLESFARQGARHGIAYAYPLLDLDLIEYAIQVPGVFMRNGGGRRILFRDATRGIIPDEVRLNPTKMQPFPGEEARIFAAQERLLSMLNQWRESPRVSDFLDLDLMAEAVRAIGDPTAPADLQVIDQTMAFQLAGTLAALDGWPAREATE